MRTAFATNHARIRRGVAAAIGVLVISGAAGFALAGPLNRARVDHGASWVVHIDMERLRESPVGCGLLTERATFPASLFHDLHTDLGIDPATEVNAITLYGLPESQSESVAVISATSAAERVPQFIRDGHAANFEEVQEGNSTLLSWKVEDSRWYLCLRTPTEGTDRVLVMSSSRERVASALGVLDGSLHNLTWGGDDINAALTLPDRDQSAARTWPFDQEPSKGSMVFVLASKAMWCDKQPASEPLRGTRGVVLDVSEQKDESGVRWTSISGHLRMEDERAAEQMAKLGQSVVKHWLNLVAAQNNPPENCCKALEEATPSCKGTEVTLNIKMDSKDLAGLIQSHQPDQKANDMLADHKMKDKPENKDTVRVIPANNPASEKGKGR